MGEVLRIEDLMVRDRRHVIITGLDLRVEEGERVALVGESGCGKTMSLRTILDQLPADCEAYQGQVLFRGQSLLGMCQKERRQVLFSHVGFVAQNTSACLHPSLKVSRQMYDCYRVQHPKARKEEALERSRSLLVRLGMSDVDRVLSSYPGQLSGGMRQRVSIALALLDDKDLLIADEPTSALDAHIRRQIESVYEDIARSRHLSMLLVSHDLGFVRRLADRVYVMYAGRIVEEGTCEEIFSSPVHPYTKALIELSSISKAERGARLAELGGYVPATGRERPECAFLERCPHSGASCHKPLEVRILSPSHKVRCTL